MSTMASAYLSIFPRRGKMKIIFVFLKKITGDNTKKTKRLAEIQVLTKSFTKRVFEKKTQVTQLFKRINYWENAANTGSN